MSSSNTPRRAETGCEVADRTGIEWPHEYPHWFGCNTHGLTAVEKPTSVVGGYVVVIPIAPLFAPIPGGPELLIIVGIAILLFGAQKIPKLARSIGESTGEFQKGKAKVENELDEIRGESAGDVEADSQS